MKNIKRTILNCITAVFAVMLVFGCIPQSVVRGAEAPEPVGSGSEVYAVRTTLRELTSADPEKGIGVYGRYTELAAEGEVPEALSRVLAEVNARAKDRVETKAAQFLADNQYPPAAEGSFVTERYRYRNISYIVNVTRADDVLFSILETELETGIGDAEGEESYGTQNCFFHSSVYDTQSGRVLSLEEFLQDPDSLQERLETALLNKYGIEGLYTGDGTNTPAWTADYLGLRFYPDGGVIPEEKRQELGRNTGRAVHVSLPYTALDGPYAEAAAQTPERFIAQIEQNTDYALPHDSRVIRVEKAADSNGKDAYRIVIRDDEKEEAWWLEYAGAESAYYVFRAQDAYYFYRLEDVQNQGYVYNFASPDGGFERFENQNAQCFDSFLHELCLAVPYNPDCVHMRERVRKFMDTTSDLNPSFVPHGHYAFLTEPGRGRTWLHFILIDDALELDSRNVGCRLLHEITAAASDDEGNESGEIVIPAGEVLTFLRVDGESELYYYMSKEYTLYKSGVRDYLYDCALSDGTQVRLVTRFENSFFIDGMYLDRIAETVTLGAAQYEAGLGELPEHFVEIGGKEYRLIRDLSLKTETGEEIDFDGDLWWEVEHYTGTFSSEDGSSKLVISENGEVTFDYQGLLFTGTLPEERYYRSDIEINLEAEDEQRLFWISVEDALPAHDPSFRTLFLYSEGEPATNEPSNVPPIEAELVREEEAE